MNTLTSILCIFVICTILQSDAASCEECKTRALKLVKEMHLSEKFDMLAGRKGTYVGNIVGNDRLGIPSLNMQDGPQGFRVTDSTGQVGTTTAWPTALSVGATWDEKLINTWAIEMAIEFKGKGANVALAPGIGLARVPTAGRNFEYLCGEDPYIGARFASQVVRGIQSVGVIANAKHWVNNEIEDERMRVSSNVDERTRFEIYYPPFEAAVSAGVLSVMCSYNRVNDVHACENNQTLQDLKSTIGFEGWVMSDWLATHSTVDSTVAGLDQEMPLGIFFSHAALETALVKGKIDIKQIDEKVFRILYSMILIGLFDQPNNGNPLANVTTDGHNKLAREIAAKSTVLLKNDQNLLPLDIIEVFSDVNSQQSEKCIAVFGDELTISGGGSGHVVPSYIITPTQGMVLALEQLASFEKTAIAKDISVYYDSGTNLTSATLLASRCQVSIVVVATTSSEGSDRITLSLGDSQNELIEAIANENPERTIVDVRCPGAVLMPWVDAVRTILISWLPGQEGGNALADVVFGTVNPSGRLSVTIPNTDNEIEFSPAEYPGVGSPPEAAYNEGLQVGYRWYQANGVTPLFPFGHGLSYTTFQYSNLKIQKADRSTPLDGQNQYLSPGNVLLSKPVASIEFTLKNIGTISGDEIPQLYITFPQHANEPPRQLKGFTKILLNPSQLETVVFDLSARDISIWNEALHVWEPVCGTFKLEIGSSSANICLSATTYL